MSEEKFIYSLLGLIVVVLLVSLTLVEFRKLDSLDYMITSGFTPVESRCAIEDSYGEEPTCVITSIKEEK